MKSLGRWTWALAFQRAFATGCDPVRDGRSLRARAVVSCTDTQTVETSCPRRMRLVGGESFGVVKRAR